MSRPSAAAGRIAVSSLRCDEVLPSEKEMTAATLALSATTTTTTTAAEAKRVRDTFDEAHAIRARRLEMERARLHREAAPTPQLDDEYGVFDLYDDPLAAIDDSGDDHSGGGGDGGAAAAAAATRVATTASTLGATRAVVASEHVDGVANVQKHLDGVQHHVERILACQSRSEDPDDAGEVYYALTLAEKIVRRAMAQLEPSRKREHDDSASSSSSSSLMSKDTLPPTTRSSKRQRTYTTHPSVTRSRARATEVHARAASTTTLDDVVCQVCNRADEHNMVLCDTCNTYGQHHTCFRPVIRRAPRGDWHCDECKK